MLPGRNRIHIIVIEPSGLLYGSEFCLLDILERLDRKAFSFEVILPTSCPFSKYLKEIRIPYFEILKPNGHKQSILTKIPTYLRVAQHLFHKKPNLIYVNQGGILRPIAAIAKLHHIPILCQIQTLEDARWVSTLKKYHDCVSAFICNSRFIAEHTLVPKKLRSIVYYGYKYRDLVRERPSQTERDRRFVVGLIGRICKSKGHYLVVEAAHRIKKAGSTKLHFRFIGDPADSLEEALIQKAVKEFDVSDIVQFRGYRKDIAKEFSEMDLLVIPSLGEPFGRILCEAAEAQVPVLLADSGGLGELSHEFNIGVRFSPESVDDFIRQLKYVRDHYEVVCEDFRSGAHRLLKSLDIDAYIHVIEDILFRVAKLDKVSVSWRGIEPLALGI